ncbi:MAG: hypothetical protein H6510_10090 [Acidobacteria bacterium]|nr:hypothetical protein [Acidobacteriota bacterium]MCB9398158.1 hypothetical protein [Acidobacteriota bacterium]
MMRLTLLLLLGLAVACSKTDTLGDEPPREVAISGQPTYENGVGELLKLKCGYCHVVPASDLSPDNIVTDLDLNQYETRLAGTQVVRGADSIGRWIKEGILDHGVNAFYNSADARQMPLDYGTPLTQAEKDALVAWSAVGSPKNSAVDPTGDKNNGAGPYFTYCVQCHDQGQGTFYGEQYYGAPIRRASITTAKVKSMWLYRVSQLDPAPNGYSLQPLDDQTAADIKAFMLDLSLLED